MPETSQFQAHPATAAEAGQLCAICQTAVGSGESVGPCPACSAAFHDECWKENGGCAIYGCARMPQTTKSDDAAAAPQTYWGQDQKDCPKCGQKIKVAAVRCRFCGTTFDTAVPLSRSEHRQKQNGIPILNSLRRTTVTLFVCGIIPFLAPGALVVGGIWFLRHRRLIRTLPAMNRVFCMVGLIASIVCTGMIVLVMALH
ncbi:MAG TPA: RING finger protein [Planctomycetota bacterium]|nr:RING finger protein [Planctomycetota bacterium]